METKPNPSVVAPSAPEVKPVNSLPVEKIEAKQNKQSNISLKLILIFLFLVIVGLAGFLVFHFVTDEHGEQAKCEPETIYIDNDKDTGDTLKPITTSEINAVQSVVATVREETEKVIGDSIWLINIYDSSVLSFRPEGYETGVPLSHTYGFTIDYQYVSRESQAYKDLEIISASSPLYRDKLYQAISSVLTAQGFRDTGESYTTASAGVPPTVFINDATGVVCGVSNWPAFECGYKTWYNKADADLSNELLKVYLEEKKDELSADYVVAQVANIKAGATEPTQTIVVGMTGSRAMFYRESPDAAWHFLSRGQAGPSCSEFDTDLAKKAYVGMVCWTDDGHESVVTM